MSQYNIACAEKFLLYLFEHNHLVDFSITKDRARAIFIDEFKELYNVKVGPGTVLFFSGRYKTSPPGRKLLKFRKNALFNLLGKKHLIDAKVEKGKNAVKKTLVDHHVVFRQEKNQQATISVKKCNLCDVAFKNKGEHDKHLLTTRHVFLDNFTKVLKAKKNQKTAIFSVDGSRGIDNIIVRPNEETTFTLKMTNPSTKDSFEIAGVEFTELEEIQFYPKLDVVLPQATIEFDIKIFVQGGRVLCFPILFKLMHQQVPEDIPVQLIIHVHSKDWDDLHPTVPYSRPSKAVFEEFVEEIVRGERPEALPSRFTANVRLEEYKLPSELSTLLNRGLQTFQGISSSQEATLNKLKLILDVKDKKNCLTPQNYTSMLDTLLFIEEHQMKKNIRDYDKPNEILLPKKHSKLLKLQVPGLAEHRPSLIRNDSVYVKEQKSSGKVYEGVVHSIMENSVELGFSQKFSDSVFIQGKKFYIYFSYNRHSIKVEHQAVDYIKKHSTASLFFPQQIPTTPLVTQPINWLNPKIKNNQQQQQAVCLILAKTSKPFPYLVFGPPGTGKTMTLVEAIQQIHRGGKENVLVCAPSNNAANEIGKRLASSIPTTDMRRYMAASFPFEKIPEELVPYTNYRNKNFFHMSIDEMKKFRIFITTLTTASRLLNGGIPPDHFQYVFVDESGHATETETLIPVAGIVTSAMQKGRINAQIVLAGDPKQLGPIIHSTLAISYGFDVSMLERLMNLQVYKKDSSGNYNPNALTKLLKNYRSHPSIIAEPNKRFYDDELESCGDDLINVALGWEKLPNKKFPVIFHSVKGVDTREANSPSFFNIQEVQVVMNYVDELIGSRFRGMAIDQTHIAVISPYKKQVEKITAACSKKHYNAITVGSVEQLQGQERLIVIISTVRSKPEYLKFDHKFQLGFLKNPKRLNVAITRAKALLIVVGNPHILQFDEHWRGFIEYCQRNGAVVGASFEFSTVDEDEITNGLQNLSLNEERNPEDGPNFSRGNV